MKYSKKLPIKLYKKLGKKYKAVYCKSIKNYREFMKTFLEINFNKESGELRYDIYSIYNDLSS